MKFSHGIVSYELFSPKLVIAFKSTHDALVVDAIKLGDYNDAIIILTISNIVDSLMPRETGNPLIALNGTILYNNV